MWVSPDGKIHKLVINGGEWGTKPYEYSECEIIISDSNNDSLLQVHNVLIGDSDSSIGRILDDCLLTMNVKEISQFTINSLNNLKFTVQLISRVFNGYIYQWDCKRKLEIALFHKQKGVHLFKLNQSKDAAFRFVKAMKIIASVPISAEKPPEMIDDVPVIEIDKLKANLYNNLASCYLKSGSWAMVVDLCKKTLSLDRDNVKAHYKLATAFGKERNFEESQHELEAVLLIEPNNKAALEQLKIVREEIGRANVKYNMLVKKMFT